MSKSNEAITQSGPGVTYKSNVTVRSDRIGGHKDKASTYTSTESAFKQACGDTKKA